MQHTTMAVVPVEELDKRDKRNATRGRNRANMKQQDGWIRPCLLLVTVLLLQAISKSHAFLTSPKHNHHNRLAFSSSKRPLTRYQQVQNKAPSTSYNRRRHSASSTTTALSATTITISVGTLVAQLTPVLALLVALQVSRWATENKQNLEKDQAKKQVDLVYQKKQLRDTNQLVSVRILFVCPSEQLLCVGTTTSMSSHSGSI